LRKKGTIPALKPIQPIDRSLAPPSFLRDGSPPPLSTKEYGELRESFGEMKEADAAISRMRRLVQYEQQQPNATAKVGNAVPMTDSAVGSQFSFENLKRQEPVSVPASATVSPQGSTFKPMQVNFVSQEDILKANDIINGHSHGSTIRALAVGGGDDNKPTSKPSSPVKKKAGNYLPRHLLGISGQGATEFVDTFTNGGSPKNVQQYRSMVLEDFAAAVSNGEMMRGSVTKTLIDLSEKSGHYVGEIGASNLKALKIFWTEVMGPGVGQYISKQLNVGFEAGGKKINSGSMHTEPDFQESSMRSILEIVQAQSEQTDSKKVAKDQATAKADRLESFDVKCRVLANGSSIDMEVESEEDVDAMAPKKKKAKIDRSTVAPGTTKHNQVFTETMKANAAATLAKIDSTKAKTEDRKAKTEERKQKGKFKKFENDSEVADKLLAQWTAAKAAGLEGTQVCKTLFSAWEAAIEKVVAGSQ